MTDEPKRRLGRPRLQRPPWREIRIRIAEDVLACIGDGGYSAFFEAAAREKLERDEAAQRRGRGRPGAGR